MTKDKGAPFGRLRYLYMGTSDVQKDLDYYAEVLGAEKVWDISSFGTRVAALRLGDALSCFSRTIAQHLAVS